MELEMLETLETSSAKKVVPSLEIMSVTMEAKGLFMMTAHLGQIAQIVESDIQQHVRTHVPFAMTENCC